MKVLGTIFLLLLCLSPVATKAFGGTKCEAATNVTVTGTIAQISKGDTPGGPVWSITPSAQTGECAVQFAYGTGPLPDSCSEGKKFTVSGELLVAAGGNPDIDVSEIRCE